MASTYVPTCRVPLMGAIPIGNGVKDIGRAYTNAFALACRMGMSIADARDYAVAEVDRLRREAEVARR